MRVRRVVRMSKARFRRRGASIDGSYRYRSNAQRLTHRTEVFYNGRRVSRAQSRFKRSAVDQYANRRFHFHAVLTDNRPPFGRIHPGVWKVRVTIKSRGRKDSATKRYRIR